MKKTTNKMLDDLSCILPEQDTASPGCRLSRSLVASALRRKKSKNVSRCDKNKPPSYKKTMIMILPKKNTICFFILLLFWYML